MRKIENQVIYDERVDCDGIHFHNVIFDGCILRSLRAGEPAYFTGGTRSVDCKMVGDGWTPRMLELNTYYLAQRRPNAPAHEAEVTMTKAERAAIGRTRVNEFVKWARKAGLK